MNSISLTAYFRDIHSFKLLTAEEEQELAHKIAQGDKDAVTTMIVCNLRLVISLATSYVGMGLAIEDLVSEGNIGLDKAAHRFRAGEGTRFGTYAAWWIKQSMRQALSEHAQLVRLPSHTMDRIRRLQKATAAMSEELERDPTVNEVAEEIGISPDWVRQIRSYSHTYASLDAPTPEAKDVGGSFGDFLPDDDQVDPREQAHESDIHRMVRETMGCLDHREQTIIELRFGMNGDDEQTLEVVGQRFNLTRERIRQIEAKALSKMRKFLEVRKKMGDASGVHVGKGYLMPVCRGVAAAA